MHTLLIHQAFVSPQEAGGTRHYEFARHCVEHGDQFTIIASNLSYLSGEQITEDAQWLVQENLDGIDLWRAYAYPTLHRSFFWRIISFLSFMCTSVWAGLRVPYVDLVMGTSPPLFQAISAWLVSALRRRPFLLEIRDLWPEFAIDMGILKNPILIGLARRLERFLYNRANHLLVNSPAYQTYLIDKGIPPEKITLIPNGVDPAMFSTLNGEFDIRTQFGLQDKFIATYTGALGQANDIPTILQTAQQLADQSNIHILLVGDGKERANLEALATQLNLDNVTFCGSLPKHTMPDVLAASDVCLATLQNIPMFQTTYPNKVFDYMAAGRPTILAIDGVIREVIENAHGGLYVPPGNSDKLAQTVLNLSNNPMLVKKMGDYAKAYVQRHFNRQTHVKQFIALLHESDSWMR